MKILDVINFLRYRATMETSTKFLLRGKCKHVSTNIFFLFYRDDTPSEPPSTNEEPSILEPVPDGEPPIVTEPVTFQLVERATKRGKTSLVDSQGFTYNIHSRRPYATYWQCTMRPKGNPCKASVTERDRILQAGKSAHNHAVEMGAATAAKIISTVKSKALEDKLKPASAIVNEVCVVLNIILFLFACLYGLPT